MSVVFCNCIKPKVKKNRQGYKWCTWCKQPWSLEYGSNKPPSPRLPAERLPDNQFRATRTPGRNQPCSCGSGKKFKKCCLK